MIASLPMYDRPETAAANDRLWDGIRHALARSLPGDAKLPQTLTRSGDPWDDWSQPDLLLSQTCGMPYRTQLHRRLTLLGSGDHRLPGCPAGYYGSVLVMHRDAASDAPAKWPALRFACNEARSHSGWAAAGNHLAELGLAFTDIALTGSHRASAHAVAIGQADLASLDAVSWQMIQRWERWAEALAVVATTVSSPALPFVTAHPALAPALTDALRQAIAALSAEDQACLQLYGLIEIARDDYLAVPTPLFPWANARKIACTPEAP